MHQVLRVGFLCRCASSGEPAEPRILFSSRKGGFGLCQFWVEVAGL